MNIKAINFDFYGTLVDWLKIWKETSQIIIDENNLKIPSLDFALEWRKIQRQIIEEKEFVPFKACIKAALIQICHKYNIKNENYHKFLFDRWKEVNPFPEVPFTLKKLKGKYNLAVCSNSSSDLFEACANKLPIKFDYVFISDEIKATKPHSKIYQFVIKSLRLKPENILHIASSQMDVKGAIASNLKVCWINRFYEKRKPDIPEPNFEIHKLNEILKLLQLKINAN